MSDGPSILQIDEHQLDIEWKNQPSLYYKAASKLADVRQRYDEAKAELDLCYAGLSLQIRDNPDIFELNKVTDKSVEACILTQKEYRMAQKELWDAKHKVDVFQARVTALDHRKKALENLVSLRLAEYFSEPRANKTEDSREFTQEQKTRRAFKPIREVDDDS